MNTVTSEQKRTELTFALGVDLESRRRGGRLPDAVVGDALERGVVTSRSDRLDPQYGPVRHVDPHVALSVDGDPLRVLAPVDVRGRVPRRLAEEGHDAVVRDLLVLGRQRDPRCIYKRVKETR